MSMKTATPVNGQKNKYPGEDVEFTQLLKLARHYRLSAKELFVLGVPGEPTSYAPFRLIAIHAVELYLNAFLLAKGSTNSEIRGMQHDLARRLRSNPNLLKNLKLRKKTSEHLEGLSNSREYLICRYDPGELTNISQVNRTKATLDEVSKKVEALLKDSL